MSLGHRLTLLAFLSAALSTAPAAAQVPDGTALARVAALRPPAPAEPASRPGGTLGGTYQTEGALIGGLALGLPTLLFLSGLCQTGDCGQVGLASLGVAAIGAFLGAAIGSAIERNPAPAAEAP
jgi:hypothetical protein